MFAGALIMVFIDFLRVPGMFISSGYFPQPSDRQLRCGLFPEFRHRDPQSLMEPCRH